MMSIIDLSGPLFVVVESSGRDLRFGPHELKAHAARCAIRGFGLPLEIFRGWGLGAEGTRQ